MRALLSFAFAALLVAFGCVGVGYSSSKLPLGYAGSSGGGGGTLALDGQATDTSIAGTVHQLTTTHTNDSIIVFAALNGGSVTSITGGGLTFSQVATSGGANPIEVWCAPASGTLASQDLVVNNTGASFISASGFGVSGATTPCTSDAGGPQTGGTTPPAITTAVANTFVFGVARDSATCTGGGSGWTKIYDCATATGNGFIVGVYEVVSATGTYTPVVASGGGTFSGGITNALK